MSKDHDALRSRMLDGARAIFQAEGLEALSVRRVADGAGTSTQMVYTIFGGKEGLLGVLYEEAAEMLAGFLDAVPSGEHYLYRLAWAYRACAISHPAHYALVFGARFAAFIPATALRGRQTRAYRLLRDGVQRAMDANELMAGDADRVADAMWTTVHGAVSLELAGYHESPEQAAACFQLAVFAIGSAFRTLSHCPLPLPPSALPAPTR
ncbi:TetR/AcrR family transcriptional regulator [bacterium]|nr:TetR/AcrR family transcriptional regulator [bacterium]